MTRLDDCEMRLKLWEPVHGPVLLTPIEDYRYLIDLGRAAEDFYRIMGDMYWQADNVERAREAVQRFEKVFFAKPDPEKETLRAIRSPADAGVPAEEAADDAATQDPS